ncbi:hypothetical protein H340_26761 [Streptomyces mobaraensis NBRC 13819 = DSM 40847]|uniref:Uncharacterized protein n=1 Tax=Streptomyces mobaraensis (strain ATCC 29032 / DSM 40847 / JCM 4168 / NBRC 13819 / NCIMB 11159 / IPCR 16-22) TaxID=1223523 RepID=M3C063_STRM1|nr:hypothetical protein H340_26761 [Streptomyces mobaraensis NBRC 13819 = DSM 40847]
MLPLWLFEVIRTMLSAGQEWSVRRTAGGGPVGDGRWGAVGVPRAGWSAGRAGAAAIGAINTS